MEFEGTQVKRGLSSKTQRVLTFFAYISPWLLGFIGFTIVPLTLSLVYSFTDVSINTVNEGLHFIGFENYLTIIFDDADFLQSIYNTLIYTGCKVVLLVFLALLAAIMLNSKIAARKVFRVLIYLPALIPAVSSAILWKLLFTNGTENVANFFLSYLGLQPVNFFGDGTTSMGTLIFIGIWNGLGPTMIVFLAAIQGVEQDIMEASDLDGAGPIRKFIHIIIPSILPVMFFVILTSVIGAMQTYTEVKLLTGGGPGNSTITMSMSIVNNAFKSTGKKMLGYACAQGWAVFVLTFVLTLIYVWNMNRTQKKG